MADMPPGESAAVDDLIRLGASEDIAKDQVLVDAVTSAAAHHHAEFLALLAVAPTRRLQRQGVSDRHRCRRTRGPRATAYRTHRRTHFKFQRRRQTLHNGCFRRSFARLA